MKMTSPSKNKQSYEQLIVDIARSLTERAVYDFSVRLEEIFNDYQGIVSSLDTYKRHYTLISEGYTEPDKNKDEIHELAFKNTVLDDLLCELAKDREKDEQ